ncbi:MAG: DUF4124 domain-containing protein [Succinivibrionaceae bacterium]
MNYITRFLGFFLFSASLNSVVFADIVYKWVDTNGNVHYSPNRPFNVDYEAIDTNFTKKQRDLINAINKERMEEEERLNAGKIKKEQELKRKEEMQRLQVCIDLTFDKTSYQRRRIEDEAIKNKHNCDLKYNLKDNKDKHYNCIANAEKKRVNKIAILEQGIDHCLTPNTTPEMVKEAIAKHHEIEKNNSKTAPLIKEPKNK